MSRRRGSITPPTDRRPSWLVRLSVGGDRPGSPRVRINKTFPSKKAAEQWLTQQLARLDTGEKLAAGRDARLTLGDWLQEWEELWSGHLGPQTKEKALQTLRLYLSPALRKRELRQLTGAEIQRHFQELAARGLAPDTIGRTFSTLRARLNEAVEHGKLQRSPMAAVKAPKVPRRQGRTLSLAEASRFLELCATDRHGALWTVLLLTGMRPAEALALQWSDFDGSQLHIRRALVRTKGARAYLDTKTGKGRVVALPPLAQQRLKTHRVEQARHRLQLGSEYRGEDLIFASTFGAPLQWPTIAGRHLKPLLGRLALRMTGEDDTQPSTLKGRGAERAAYRERVRVALAKTGLERFRPYDLRHSAATLMIAAGESPRTVAEILGHSSVVMTLDTYTHVSPELMERAAGRLEESIRGAATGREASGS